jgi:hypothetical protein
LCSSGTLINRLVFKGHATRSSKSPDRKFQTRLPLWKEGHRCVTRSVGQQDEGPKVYARLTEVNSVSGGPPTTTTSASSSDLRPRNHAKFLGLLPHAHCRMREVWVPVTPDIHIPPNHYGSLKRQKLSSISRHLRYPSSRSRFSRLLFNLDFAFSVFMLQLTGCPSQAFSYPRCSSHIRIQVFSHHVADHLSCQTIHVVADAHCRAR